MKKIWKNVLGIALIVAISISAAIATSAYLTIKKQAYSPYVTEENSYGFKQPIRMVNYETVAAEHIDFTVAAENAVHAVVHIKSTVERHGRAQQYVDPFEYFFGFGGRGYQQRQPQPQIGFGSGVIISSDGYIITNNHVVEHADDIEVTLNDSRKFTAKLIGTDPETDIALLKIDGRNFATIPFGDSDKLKIGEWVLAVGNPFNLTSTVTAGIVSAKGRGTEMYMYGSSNDDRERKIQSYIQTDAAVNRGNSGGALVNTKGELVGINTMIMSETGNYAGYSFAVPISIAGKVVEDLKKHGAVQRAFLGVQIKDVKHVEENRKKTLKVLEGAYIDSFSSQSAAKTAGMEEGDVIIAVNDSKIRTASDLQEKISRFRPGDKVNVTIDRNGSEKTLKVELRNSQGNTEIVKEHSDAVETLGAAFKEISDKQKRELGISYGIEVAALFNGKLKEAGISKGFIIMLANDQKINSSQDLEKVVERIIKKGGDDMLLILKGINSNGRNRYYAIDLAN
ncbi:MAG: Do family serine endopeptidase [Tannerellaceae bacterium]|jgi:Do/DeqQ family serine protease|nr:Do family serine endopeptidase [Tannerellaceae bacterium]